MIDAMSEGVYDIISSLAWQHHAYRSSGLGALNWIAYNSMNMGMRSLLESWEEMDVGINEKKDNLIAWEVLKVTSFEQKLIIVPTWDRLQAITPVNDQVSKTFSTLADNVMKPHGSPFTVVVPGGNLADTGDRWKWIDDSFLNPNGIIGAWKTAGKSGQRVLVGKTLRIDSERFTRVPGYVRAIAGLLPGERGGMQVNDDLDIP